MSSLAEQLQELLSPVLKSESVELVELLVKGRVGSQTVKVFIDSADGITLDRCSQISSSVSDVLDTEDIMPGKYRLEVSSPGVGRPLKSKQDFIRNLNRQVEIMCEVDGEVSHLEGKLVNVSANSLFIANQKNETEEISIATIKHGKIKLPW